MTRRLLVGSAVCATLLAAAPNALAGPGGSLSGEIDVRWASAQDAPEGNFWNGGVNLALQSGAAATDEAVRTLRESGRTIREVRPFFVQRSSITSLSSALGRREGSDTYCWDYESERQVPGESRETRTAGAVTQSLVPMSVDPPELNLLKGKGTIEIEFYTDNPGYREGSSTYPFPAAGEYFMPVPGTAVTDRSASVCGRPSQSSEERSVLSTRGDALVPFALALWLNEAELPMRRVDGAWVVDVTRSEETTMDREPLALTMNYRVELRMAADLAEVQARCRLPAGRAYRRLRSAGAVKKLLRRAGLRGRYGGAKAMRGMKAGRYFPAPGSSSSGYLPCASKVVFHRSVRAR